MHINQFRLIALRCSYACSTPSYRQIQELDKIELLFLNEKSSYLIKAYFPGVVELDIQSFSAQG